MFNLNETINGLLKISITESLPCFNIDLNKYTVNKGKNSDYQFNNSILLSKELSLELGIVINSLCTKLKEKRELQDVQVIKIRNNQIIEFNINDNYVGELINGLYDKIKVADDLPKYNWVNQSLVFDYSSPNIAKEMHVGHLRSTIIGHSLANIFEYMGAKVTRVNHLGDWGTQFGMLISYIKNNKIDKYNLSDLTVMYKEAAKKFKSDEQFKEQSHLETFSLQSGDSENTSIWKKIYEISQTGFDKIYSQLSIKGLETKGESFYQSRMKDLTIELKEKLFNDEYGRKVLFVNGLEIPLILVKSDGAFTYDTSDLAAIKYRLVENKTDRVIYVVDSGQALHLKTVFQAAIDLGWAQPNQLTHVDFGLVLGSDGKKLKTRDGETIKLQGLLDTSYEHAINVTIELLRERNIKWNDDMINNVSKKIAINCIKYTDLSNPRVNNYKFSPERMMNNKGNTAVYLMYAMVRSNSILRKIPNIDVILSDKTPININDIDTKSLSIQLVKYEQALLNAIETLCPHHICSYMYDLAECLAKFYESNRCFEFDVDGKIITIHNDRIKLVYLFTKILCKFFALIGLEIVDQI